MIRSQRTWQLDLPTREKIHLDFHDARIRPRQWQRMYHQLQEASQNWFQIYWVVTRPIYNEFGRR